MDPTGIQVAKEIRRTILAAVAIGGLVILELSALEHGIDGQILLAGLGILGTLGGIQGLIGLVKKGEP